MIRRGQALISAGRNGVQCLNEIPSLKELGDCGRQTLKVAYMIPVSRS